jgi:hypothetical protein
MGGIHQLLELRFRNLFVSKGSDAPFLFKSFEDTQAVNLH